MDVDVLGGDSLETMLMATPAQRLAWLAWLEEALRLAYDSGTVGDDRPATRSRS